MSPADLKAFVITAPMPEANEDGLAGRLAWSRAAAASGPAGRAGAGLTDSVGTTLGAASVRECFAAAALRVRPQNAAM
jgi:hypothetical protein